ncbi:MAG: SseB family protein [Lachnospiraceae bacterium]|nr:SseB family protein [Lachnospiraceae bacterium]
MGLFDKFKKKKVEEVDEIKVDAPETEEAVEETIDETEAVALEPEASNEDKEAKEAATEETAEDADDEGGRFTLLVEDAFQLEEENGVVVVGNLHGKIKKGEKIYILFPNNRMMTSAVEELEIGPGRRVEEAEDDRVAVQIFDVKKKEHMPPFTIITNIVPNPDAQDGKELENPLLLGMSMEYPKYGQQVAYNNLLIYIMCHTKYVVPASMNADAAAPGKVPVIQFPSLAEPNGSGRYALPIFTDWNALSRWEGLMDAGRPVQLLVMPFQDAVEVCKGRGIVLNPFGPMVISLSSENIQQITNMENYKKEFGNRQVQSKPAQEEVQQNKTQGQPQMMLGVPKPDKPEVKAVTDAIVACVKQEPDVKRIDLLLKVDLQQKKSFVCIVDCPAEKTAGIGEAIQKAVAPNLKEVENIEFFLYGSAKFVNDMVSENSVIYQR